VLGMAAVVVPGAIGVTAGVAIAIPPRGTMVPAPAPIVVPGQTALFQYPPCDPYQDSMVIHAALKGNPLHTDGRSLINIICNRHPAQLQVIALVYAQQFGHNVKQAIKHNTKTQFSFQKLLIRRFRPRLEQKARAIHKAVHNKGVSRVNDGRLIDTCAFTPNAEWPVLKNIIRQETGHDIAALVNTHTTNTGDFKLGLDILIAGARDESPVVNATAVPQDVQMLYLASDGRVGHDTHTFIRVLCPHAPWYNAALNLAYGKTHKHDLIRAIDKTSMLPNMKHLLTAVCTAPYDYFADRLYYALKSTPTDDHTIVYIMSYLDRAEIQVISGLVHQRHGSHDLYTMFQKCLSGNEQHACLALCGQTF